MVKIGKCPSCEVELHQEDMDYKSVKVVSFGGNKNLCKLAIICKKCGVIIGFV